MRKLFNTLAGATLLLAAGGLMAAGCAGDIDEVDRVQPAYVKKTDLLCRDRGPSESVATCRPGSWYYRRTVVDAPETMGPYASIGTGDLFTIERVRWDVQEDYLLAYRDYAYIPGGEEDEYEGADYYGSPIAAFPIKKHFDIIYEYNAATGEKTNVRTENDTDRPWHERDFMRVDWSKNPNPNLDFILPMDVLDMNSVAGGDFYVHEDEALNPYRARIEPNKGYLDFVVNHYVWPDPYVCWIDFDFDIYDAINCGAGDIRVRHAFMRVDEEQNETYEPLYYPDSITVKDDNGKEIADPATGEVLREPVWERFGYYRLERLTWDDERGLTESGRLYRIIRFNIWDKSVDAGGNTIPYAERQVRPIIYYLNWDFPQDLKEAAINVVGEGWNQVFKNTVASLQNKSVDQVGDVFVVVENSCSANNLDAYFANHKQVLAQVEAKMGKTWPLLDIDADQLVHWCSGAEYFSQGLDEPERFIWQQIGDPRFNMLYWVPNITPAGFSGYGPMLGDPVTGLNVVSSAFIMGWTIESAATRALEYIDYINGEVTLTELLMGENLPERLVTDDYDPRQHTYSYADVREMARGIVGNERAAAVQQRMQSLGATPRERMVPLENSSYYAERLARVQGTQLERDFLTRPEDLMIAGRGSWMPGMPVSDELWAQASVANRMQAIRGKRAKTTRFMQEHCFDPEMELDGALVGLAAQLKDLSRDERRAAIREMIFTAVALHEIGHNVGLRHNFEGSYDALNYLREFWQIEADSATQAERDEAGQPEYMYSSIMDYHGKINADFRGLAPWDNAAVKFGYGQLVEQFADDSVVGGDTLRQWMRQHDYKELLYPSDVDGYDDGHPPYFSSIDQIYDREDVIWDWENQQSFDHIAALDAHEVPYMFCSDEYNGWLPTCKTFDFGANQREVQVAAKVNYKNYFIFSRYLRNRLVIDWDRALARAEMAFADTTLTYHYYYYYLSKDLGFADTDAGRDMQTAVEDGLNLISDTLSMPTPGTYYRCDDGAGNVTYERSVYYDPVEDYDPLTRQGWGENRDGVPCDMNARLEVPLGDGFPLFFGFDDEYITWAMTYLGTYWDKMAALFELTNPFAYFIHENLDEDLRSTSISLYRLYPDAVNDIFLNLIELDREGLARQVDEDTIFADNQTFYERKMVPGSSADCAGNCAKVAPAMVRNLQIYSVLYGMVFMSSPLDTTLNFSTHARVAVKGAPDDMPAFEEQAALDPTSVVECAMPEGGTTYRAMRSTSQASRVDIAFNFVTRCRAEVETRAQRLADWQAARAAFDGADPSDPDYDDLRIAERDAHDEWTLAESNLRATEQILIFMRQCLRLYEHGVGY